MTSLEKISECVSHLGRDVMFYLAAAVADFYVPWKELPEHKIESNSGELKLHLQTVPKALGILRYKWAPNSFVVSFKLETDENILIQKAKSAIKKYFLLKYNNRIILLLCVVKLWCTCCCGKSLENKEEYSEGS